MFNFLKPESAFFDLFDRLAAHVVVSTEQLQMAVHHYPGPSAIQHIHDEEHNADAVTHELLAELDTHFQTPFDREDIHALAGELDDIVDDTDALAHRLVLYHVEAIEPRFLTQTDVLAQAARSVQAAVGQLRTTRRLDGMQPYIAEVHRLEKAGDEQHHAALNDLFNGRKDALFVLKWKELYGLAERAINRCEDVGDTLEKIAIKSA